MDGVVLAPEDLHLDGVHTLSAGVQYSDEDAASESFGLVFDESTAIWNLFVQDQMKGEVFRAVLAAGFTDHETAGSELTADRRSYSTYSAAVPISDQVWFEGSYKTLNSPDTREQGSAVSGTVDFRFRRNWSLRTEIGTIGTGVDLLWNYRY